MIEGVVSPLNRLIDRSAFVGEAGGTSDSTSGKSSSNQEREARLADLIDISEQASNSLDNKQSVIEVLEKGRGALARSELQLVEKQLEQVKNDFNLLKELTASASDEGDNKLESLTEEIVDKLGNLSSRLGFIKLQDLTEPPNPIEEVLKEFHGAIKNYRDVSKELQAIFENDDRIPPRLSTLIKDLAETKFPEEPQQVSIVS